MGEGGGFSWGGVEGWGEHGLFFDSNLLLFLKNQVKIYHEPTILFLKAKIHFSYSLVSWFPSGFNELEYLLKNLASANFNTERMCIHKSWVSKVHFIFIKYFIVVLLQSSQFFPLCSPLPSPSSTPTVNPHCLVQAYGSFIHISWLVPSPSYPAPHSPVVIVSLFLVSMPLVLFVFCTLASSCRWDHVVLSFTAWLNSLTFYSPLPSMLLRKGRSSFLSAV